MTGAARFMSAAEYLEWEREQLERHEFHDGEVFAIAGGSGRHSMIAAGVVSELRAVMRNHGCRAMTSDMRIAAEPLKRYVYANAVLVCGPIQYEPGTNDVLLNPAVVVEVLSPSTEAGEPVVRPLATQSTPLTSDAFVAETRARARQRPRQPRARAPELSLPARLGPAGRRGQLAAERHAWLVNDARDARSAYRNIDHPGMRDGIVGFRPAQGHS